MKNLKTQLTILLLTSYSIFSQTKINPSDFLINIGFDDRNKVGREINITKKDGSKFEQGNYIIEIKQGEKEITILFKINENGFPFSTIEGRYLKNKYKFTIKDKIIERFEYYDYNTDQLQYEQFKKKDSIITNLCFKNNLKILKKIEYKGTIIYEDDTNYDNNGIKTKDYNYSNEDDTN